MRLCDLAEWQVLRIKCSRCQYKVLVDPKAIARRSKDQIWATDLKVLEPLFKCTGCNAKGTAEVEIGPMPGRRE